MLTETTPESAGSLLAAGMLSGDTAVLEADWLIILAQAEMRRMAGGVNDRRTSSTRGARMTLVLNAAVAGQHSAFRNADGHKT